MNKKMPERSKNMDGILIPGQNGKNPSQSLFFKGGSQKGTRIY